MDARIADTPALLTAIESLAATLERSEPIAAFREAKARLDADEGAGAVLKELAEINADLRQRQVKGTMRREDIDRMRAAQQRAWSDPVIAAFAEAQQDATAYLPQVNDGISELLGWDFASMAAPPASC